MEPCKVSQDTPRGSPIALSWPHFYQADPSYLAAVSGVNPSKDKHQFYIDVLPQLGIPLALRPRLQINAIIRKDSDIHVMRLTPNIPVLLVFPVGGDRNAAMASVLTGIRVVTETVRMGQLHVRGERCVVMGSVLSGIMSVVG